jgi:hypothetical protein
LDKELDKMKDLLGSIYQRMNQNSGSFDAAVPPSDQKSSDRSSVSVYEFFFLIANKIRTFFIYFLWVNGKKVQKSLKN